MTIDQRYGHRLFDRIQKQPTAWKTGNHLRMNGHNHRTEPRVCKLAGRAQFYLAVSSVRAGHQCRIGNTELQMRYVHEPDPLSLMTMAQRQVAGRVLELFQRGTLRAPLN